MHGALPAARIVAIGLQPTPARWHLTGGGRPKPEHFIADGQHMTPEGYKVWTRLVRPHLERR